MKLIMQWLVYAAAIGITTYILPGVYVVGISTLLIVAIVLGAINTFIKPVLVLLTLPITIVTFGLFLLVINTLLAMSASYIVPGFTIDGFWWAFVFSIVVSFIGGFLSNLTESAEE